MIQSCAMELDDKTLRASLIYLFFTAWLINIALHIPSFYRTTFRGDENVYLFLSKTMGWNLSQYSTSSHPGFSRWPNTIYRQPVFHHGPLLPYIMKVGAVFGNPASTALIFANCAMGALFIHLLVLFRRLSIPPAWQILSFFAVAIAPLLLFSTTRIHQDAIAGIFIACAIIAFIEALEKKSWSWSLWCGILFSMALNLRFSAIICLPLIVLAQIYYLMSVRPRLQGITPGNNIFKRELMKFEYWKVFSIIVLIVATVGMQHFYRLFAAYGSIFPWDFMQDDSTNSWYQFIQTRTRSKNFINLILLIPLFTVFFVPQTWKTIRTGLARNDWGAFCTLCGLYLLAVLFIFSYAEIRFFALATAMFYCSFPWIMARSKTTHRPYYLCLIALSFSLMITAGYREVVQRPNEVFHIVPVIYELVPPLQKYW